jgi:hypothetical protein
MNSIDKYLSQIKLRYLNWLIYLRFLFFLSESVEMGCNYFLLKSPLFNDLKKVLQAKGLNSGLYLGPIPSFI